MINVSDAPQYIQDEFGKMVLEIVRLGEIFPAVVLVECCNLRVELMYHSWRYYKEDDPVVPDAEYDLLFRRLEAFERQYPHLETPLSPTQRVGVPMPPKEK